MNPNQLSNLGTLVKVGLATFCGAFFAALSLTTIPVTLDGWKSLVMPALAAAVASELVFLRSQIAAYLSGNPLGTPPAPPAPAPVVVVPPAVVPAAVKAAGPLAVLFFAASSILFAGHLAACTPAEIAATNAVFTDVQTACQAEALASSVIPAGTEASVVAKDVASACGIASTLLPWVQNVVTSWMAAQAAAGTVPSVPTYSPTPMLKKRAPHASLDLGPLDRPRWRLAPAFAVHA